MCDSLQKYLFDLWTRKPWGELDARVHIEGDLFSKLNSRSDARLFQRLLSVYSRCVQRKGISASPDLLVHELASSNWASLNSEKVGIRELSRLVLGLMYGEYGIDSIVYGPEASRHQRWGEIEVITSWSRDELIAISTCYRRQASKFLVDRLNTEESD